MTADQRVEFEQPEAPRASWFTKAELSGPGPETADHGVEPHPGDIVEHVTASGVRCIGVVVERNEHASAPGWWFVRLISDPTWDSFAYLGYAQSQLRVLDCVKVRHTQITPEFTPL